MKSYKGSFRLEMNKSKFCRLKGGIHMRVTRSEFGQIENKPVHLFSIANENGVEVVFMDYGCTITKIITPDLHGNNENIVLGYERLEDYVSFSPFFGCIVGRVAGRIAGASFELNGQTYSLAKNEGDNHLHGGIKGFDKVIWNANEFERDGEAG